MTYTTKQVIAACKITRKQIQDWLAKGAIPVPPLKTFADGHSTRIWSDRDIQAIKRYKRTRTRRGRPRKATRK